MPNRRTEVFGGGGFCIKHTTNWVEECDRTEHPSRYFIYVLGIGVRKVLGIPTFNVKKKDTFEFFTKFGSNAPVDTKRQFAKTKSFIMGVVDFLFGDYDYKELCLCSLPCSKSRAPMRFYAKDEPLPFVLAMIMGLQHACVFHCWFAICMVISILTLSLFFFHTTVSPWLEDWLLHLLLWWNSP